MIAAAILSLLAFQPEPARAAAAQLADARPHWRPPCTAARAVPVAVETIRTDPDWRTRCVRVRGIQVGWRLYDSRRAMTEAGAIWGENVRHSLPLLRRAGMRVERRARASEIDAIGTVQSCAFANDMVAQEMRDNPGSIVMVAGYCHTSLEAYINVTSVSVVSHRPVFRLLAAEVPSGASVLTPVTSRGAAVEAQAAAARRLLGAIRTGDATTFARLVDPNLASSLAAHDGPRAEWVRDRQRDTEALLRRISARGSVFDGLGSPEQRQEIILHVPQPEPQPDPHVEQIAGEAADHLTICWCRLGDCAGRWPVLEADADNHPSRPYACVHTNDFLLGPRDGTVMQAKPNLSWTGLAEPPWPVADLGGR